MGTHRHTRHSYERGQATPEWLGLVLLVSLTMVALVSLGFQIPGLGIAKSIVSKIVCAAGLDSDCGGKVSELVSLYGAELASEVTGNTPELDYEEGMRALPVDFRTCRDDACAEGAEAGGVSESIAGEQVTLFSHVVDCRNPAEPTPPQADCGGEAAGNLYLQYWAYYPSSQTSKELLGDAGFHEDDWESFQIRITPDGTEARASSHHGYNGDAGDPINDTGIFGGKPGWVSSSGHYAISGGSHAGRVGPAESAPVRRPSSLDRGPRRWTNPSATRVIPIESLRREWDDHEFEVTPPWRKPVYLDPESRGT